ncbi:flagellar hook-associated protein FlgL [Fonticella tunisiensis]|uniref:Flagellar hook-associated protein 3 FlgL n=1 Tax=Fonticella tunisiensis TaxID=1096341 RepID=A0A4R7KD42_9CLOT|nr:flagellar hook-associated protein FlgL [Fonticella tunisiensis]TDT50622.1 flagellar hook-associated protein 3 FlgL [Fonticella tunisiensis]
MRITNRVLVKSYLSDLTANLENMKKYQEQLSSGKEVRRPSDNPFKAARAMELTTSIAVNERYKANIDEGIGWLETTDVALGQMNDALQRIRELTVQGSNGTYDSTQRYSIQKEIEQLKESLAQIGNTFYDGRYIFGGDKTTEPPFKIVDGKVIYQGSTNGLKKEFSQGVIMDIAINGNKFANDSKIQPADEDGVFKVISEIINDLANNKSPSDRLKELDEQIDNILKLRAEVGAKSNRLNAMKSKNEDEIFNMTELLSKTVDIDIAQKIMEYSVMESIYTASLQAGAKILQPSLLDFLR